MFVHIWLRIVVDDIKCMCEHIRDLYDLSGRVRLRWWCVAEHALYLQWGILRSYRERPGVRWHEWWMCRLRRRKHVHGWHRWVRGLHVHRWVRVYDLYIDLLRGHRVNLRRVHGWELLCREL